MSLLGKMKNIHKLKKLLVLAGVGYVVIIGLLIKVIGDSSLLAFVAIAGWALLFAGVMKYLALKKSTSSDETKR